MYGVYEGSENWRALMDRLVAEGILKDVPASAGSPATLSVLRGESLTEETHKTLQGLKLKDETLSWLTITRQPTVNPRGG